MSDRKLLLKYREIVAFYFDANNKIGTALQKIDEMEKAFQHFWNLQAMKGKLQIVLKAILVRFMVLCCLV